MYPGSDSAPGSGGAEAGQPIPAGTDPAGTTSPGPYQPGAPAGGGPGYPVYQLRRPTNSMAVAALVTGLVGFLACPVVGAVAVYLGNRARAEIRRTGEEGDGIALAGVIVGWIGVGITALMIVLLIIYFGLLGAVFAGTLFTT